MSEPLTLLLIGLAFLVLIYVLVKPENGIISLLVKNKNANQKTMLEDALKFIYNCEYNNINCTLNSIAGNLNISADAAAGIVAKLQNMGLIQVDRDYLALTSEGKSYALRVIRVHRLWEKFLADETSMTEKEWHKAAEEIEHKLSEKEVDKLAAQIGNPVFDPHGDPIPTSTGEIPEKAGKHLTEMLPGEMATIIHIEDEPQTIYSQILAEGLYPGMQIRMIEVNDKRVKFEANGEECILSPLIAKSITIGPLKFEKPVEGKLRTLSNLKVGEKGIVLGIAKSLRGQQRRRLMDLGIVPGTEIEAELESISGDPVAYRVRGATIALRKDQADKIYLVKEEEKN
ncbi:DtxR family transcriptional regulator [Ignavibacterium album JCM 16511]|uniref:DtxR family transcriptional regulator n=1 Tax=Ignavibacterium album (strain DSM 19864 / JCM 16511 / NBRC 101810 / Mat9-16) TaxID=945713 RepID=I0AGW4_IGNAJ|nr:metal-dependent transcriptional regulator [Ignavibacterium album]AFH48221.1 DtxR family transcriptional regulator [Ignavibacterium album JCM 16511]